jgi:UDP-glucuronate decarboxylase
VRVARIFNTYGPRLSAQDGRVVSNLVSQALAGEDITVFGDGHQTRSFCFVADLVEGLVRLMEHPVSPRGPVNLGNPEELTICQLVDIVLDLTGSSSQVSLSAPAGRRPQAPAPDISRAIELLGWRPTTSLGEGLRATIAWFDAKARLQPGPSETELVA